MARKTLPSFNLGMKKRDFLELLLPLASLIGRPGKLKGRKKKDHL